jgi:hypothetical protein
MDPSSATIQFTRMFYPKWWLDLTGYFDVGGTDGGILFQPNTESSNGVAYSLLGSVFLLLVGFAMGKWSSSKSTGDGKSNGYIPVPVVNTKPSFATKYQDIEMLTHE